MNHENPISDTGMTRQKPISQLEKLGPFSSRQLIQENETENNQSQQ